MQRTMDVLSGYACMVGSALRMEGGGATARAPVSPATAPARRVGRADCSNPTAFVVARKRLAFHKKLSNLDRLQSDFA